LAGGIVLILVLSSLARARLAARAHATLFGLALAAWSLALIGISKPDANPGMFIAVFVIALLTAVFGLTILTAANLHLAETAIGLPGRASARLAAILGPPLAYLSRRPVRTGLTTGVFAVIVATLTLFAVLHASDRPDYERLGNGYDLVLSSTGMATIELPADVRADVTRSTTLLTRGYLGPLTSGDPFASTEGTAPIPLLQVEPDVADDPPVRLAGRDSRFDTDHAVWEAVARDPSLIVSSLGSPGQQITLRGQDGAVSFTIAGSPPAGLSTGLFGTDRALAPFRAAPLGVTMLVDLRDPAQAGTAARTIERALFAQGVDADPVRGLLDQEYRGQQALLSVLDVLTRMGLVVGILGLGIVALRSVTERRHALGILRAIGYKRRNVIIALLTESTVTATIGAAVGVTAGIAVGYLFYRQNRTGTGFGIDLPSVGSLLGLIYLAVLAVTIGPAWRASRLPPAEAVRQTA
jgi:hypothetical protein